MEFENLQFEEVELDCAWKAHERNNGGFRINWESNIGFGQLTFWIGKDGVLYCDTETLGQEFALCVMEKFVKSAVIKD